jgi:ABC-2 type transport system permease protein
MSSVASIWKREFRAYWYSPVAYIVITIFLVIISFVFFQGFFIQNNASLRPMFALLPWAFMGLIPAITMRVWAEERKSGTMELLMTKPVSEAEAVLGKFLATLSFLAVILLLTLPMAVAVHLMAQSGLDWGTVAAGYVGSLLLGATYMAIGSWASSMTDNQIVAFLLALALIFLGIIIGSPFITTFLPGSVGQVLDYIGLQNHFFSIERGVLDSRDIIYYLSLIFLFLYFTVRTVEKRKWS